MNTRIGSWVAIGTVSPSYVRGWIASLGYCPPKFNGSDPRWYQKVERRQPFLFSLIAR